MAVPFFVGFIMGAAFTACGFVLLLTRPKHRRRDPVEWDEKTFAPPSTKVTVNRKRNIEL